MRAGPAPNGSFPVHPSMTGTAVDGAFVANRFPEMEKDGVYAFFLLQGVNEFYPRKKGRTIPGPHGARDRRNGATGCLPSLEPGLAPRMASLSPPLAATWLGDPR